MEERSALVLPVLFLFALLLLAWKEGTFFEIFLEERDPGAGPPSPCFGNIWRLAATIYDVRLLQLRNKKTWNIAGVVVVVLVSHEQLDSS